MHQSTYMLLAVSIFCFSCTFEETELIDSGDTSSAGGDETGSGDDIGSGNDTMLRECNFAWPEENFDDNVLDTRWLTVASPGFAVEETNEALSLSLGQNEEWSQVGIRSAVSVDFTNKQVSLKILDVPISSSSTQAHFSLYDFGSDGYFSLVLMNGSLRFIYRDPPNGGWETLGTTVFDPTVHVYWQLRHQGETLTAEVSTDSISFSPIGSVNIKDQQNKIIEDSTLYIRSVTTELVEEAGHFVIDDINVDTHCE